jgi:hypothetical protein
MTVRITFFLIASFLLVGAPAFGQWITFTDQTATYLNIPNVANDSDEKDFALGDLDNDGDLDLVNVKKEAFYADNPRSHMLIMNVGGVMTDQTATYAPGFISNPTLARVVLIGDLDNDGWKDVVVVNTNSQVISTNYQTQYYKNMGSSGGTWLGLQLQSGRIPIFSPVPRFCSAAVGDPDGDGDLDLFLGDYNNSLEDRLCINDGTGHFIDATASWFPTGNNSSTFSVESTFADADGDGDQDIFESDGQVGLMKVHVNHRIHVPGGAGQVGNFFVTQIITSGQATYTNAVGDLNNDGKPDIYQGRDGQDAYSINTSTPSAVSFTTTTLNGLTNPKTQNFAGNAYIVDMDGDGDNDLAMADTDVDIAGCNRHAVLYRNGLIGPAQPQLLMDPWGSPDTYTNIHTQGTHDLAILDLNGDGLMDIINGRCIGYHVFIQDGPPFSLSVTEPVPGAINMVVAGGVPNTALYTGIATVIVNPLGSGPFFGLDPSAYTNFLALYPNAPVYGFTNGSGGYNFSLPGGVPTPFPTQWRSFQLVGPSGMTATNISTITF